MIRELKKWFLRKTRSNSIFRQLVSFTLLVSILPILIGSLLFGKKMIGIAGNTINISYSHVVNQYISNINDKFYQYRSNMNQIAENTVIRDNLMGETQENNAYLRGSVVSLEVAKTLNLETNTELRNCMVYSCISQVPIYGKRVTTVDEASRETWYVQKKLSHADVFAYWTVDGKDRVLSIVQNMIYVDPRNYVSQKIGFLKLDIYASKLFSPVKIQLDNDYLYDLVIYNDADELVYSSNDNYNDVISTLDMKHLSTSRMYPYKDVMVYKGVIENYGLKVLFFFDGSRFTQEKSKLVFSYIPVVILLVLGVIVATYLFTRYFSNRIELLVSKFKTAETGDLTVTEPIEGNDEIAVLDRQFSHMLEKLDMLIQKNYIQQLENKENELRNLQLQINPHFLYNTLETISSMAAVQQMFGICEICEKLGDIFRYSIGKNYGNYVTLEQELHHIQNYIFIQKARFGNKFEVFYNVEPEILKKHILRFILQPLVENAILHGLSKSTSCGTLEISAIQQEGMIIIKVEDDGIGMSMDKVIELNEYINDERKSMTDGSKSIGVKNVNQRIKLSCGDIYGITVKSEALSGCYYEIRLPLHAGEA